MTDCKSNLGNVQFHPRSIGCERSAVCNQLHCHYTNPIFQGMNLSILVLGSAFAFLGINRGSVCVGFVLVATVWDRLED